MINQIRKRDGSVVAFEPGNIERAIKKALQATKVGNKELAADLAEQVVKKIVGGV